MSKTGRLTVPAEARKELGLKGSAELEVQVESGGGLVLRPAVLLPLEDAWAYTPKHRSQLVKAHEDSRAGRVRNLTEAELRDLDISDS